MSFQKKLLLLPGVAAIALMLQASILLNSVGNVHDSANFANVSTVPSLVALDKAKDAFWSLRINLWKLLASPDARRDRPLEDNIAAALPVLDQTLQAYAPLIADDEDRAFFAAEVNYLARYKRRVAEALELVQAGRRGEALELSYSHPELCTEILQAFLAHYQHDQMLGQRADSNARHIQSSALWTGVGLAIAMLGLTVGFGYAIVRQIMRQLGGDPSLVAKVASTVAHGDFSTEIILRPGDGTSLLATVREMQAQLQRRRDSDRATLLEKERAAAEAILSEREHLFRTQFELSPVGKALVAQDDSEILQVNHALMEPTQFSAEELLGKSLWALLPSEYHASYASLRAQLKATERVGPLEMEILRRDGGRFPALVSLIMHKESSGRCMVWTVIQDISQIKAAQAQLSLDARRDKLTGLANRTLFMEKLELAVARVRGGSQQRFAVFFLDFDRFKLVNDTLGHEAGDELLRQITQRLRAQLRLTDTSEHDADGGVLCRFGGDEFLLLINQLNAGEDAVGIAERVLNALAPPYDIFGSEVHSSASIGIVTSEQCAGTPEEVVRNADVAMYEAKRSGRACSVVFSESMHTRLTRHVSVETSLRRAIGSPELYVVYQPIVELATGRVVSAEALLRWQHPTLGTVSPGEFIPIAEESGLIIPVGRWVQREACLALADWRALDPVNAPAAISINVSRAELALGHKLLAQIQETLEHTGLPARCLTLEVTEREVMRNPEACIKLMNELRQLGVKLSMDDFGTGTSSLGVLRNYPFDTIKIDRSFVCGLPGNRDVLAVINATVTLIENLGMTSLAEGIETPAQAAVLHSLGCRLAQGYLFSRPVKREQMLGTIPAVATRLIAPERSPV